MKIEEWAEIAVFGVVALVVTVAILYTNHKQFKYMERIHAEVMITNDLLLTNPRYAAEGSSWLGVRRDTKVK